MKGPFDFAIYPSSNIDALSVQIRKGGDLREFLISFRLSGIDTFNGRKKTIFSRKYKLRINAIKIFRTVNQIL